MTVISTLGCLVCGGILDEIGGGLYRCRPCGFDYPADVLAETPPGEWERIRTERLYCLTCPQALPGMPTVHIDRHGQPVACPKARRVWWRRWFARRPNASS